MKRKAVGDEEKSAAYIDDEAVSSANDDAYISEGEESSERIDYSDEEDEEELESDGDYEDRPQKKAKKVKRNRFVDMEAEVGDEDEEDEDEEDTGYGLSDEAELSDEDLPRPEDYIRRAPPPRFASTGGAEEEFDAEAEEKRLRRLYGSQRGRFAEREGEIGLPKTAVLMPKSTDPKLWLVKCKPGRERDAVAALLRGLLDFHSKSVIKENPQEFSASVAAATPQVFSAICRDSLKGYIYVEAYKPADIMAVVHTLHLNHMIYASHLSKPALVPMAEMADVLSATKAGKDRAGGAEAETAGMEPGDWVRIKRGKYSGDLAQIVEGPEDLNRDRASLALKIKLLPRLSYRSSGGAAQAAKKDRVPARSFDPQEASQYGPVTKSRGHWIYAGEFYKDGFLVKEVKAASLAVGAVPRPDELERFGVATASAKASPTKNAASAAQRQIRFGKGDKVVVREGDMKGIAGTVFQLEPLEAKGASKKESQWVSVALDHPDIREPVSLRADQLQKHFDVGQHAKIIDGPHAGEVGMVVDVLEGGRSILFFPTATQIPFQAPIEAVQAASATEKTAAPSAATPNIGALSINQELASKAEEIELHDLVQTVENAGNPEAIFGVVTRVLAEEGMITIFDQSGANKNLSLKTIKKIDTKPLSRAADSALAASGGPTVFKAGDRVQIDSAEGQAFRPATIIQVYRTIAFCKTLDDPKELVVRRFTAIHLLGPHPSSLAQSATYSQSSRGAAGPGGRHLLGKSVSIVGGVYKGYIGIVKSVTDTEARVELHTNSKIVTVPRDRVIPYGAGAAAGHAEGGRNFPAGGPQTGKTPAWSSAKTPGWSSSKTPAWSSSAKTPGWGASTTPAVSGSAHGNRTPAWNTSAKTPAWNTSSSSAAAAGGARTPAWNAPGGKTPLWSSSNVKTPSGVDGRWAAPTPAWGPPNSTTAGGNAAEPSPSTVAGLPSWAVPGALVKVKGSGAEEMHPISQVNAASHLVSLPSGSYKPVDLEPVAPGKKDRVKLLNASASEPSTGVVIGLDGPDAVVRLDETSNFRIVPVSNLVKLQQ